MCDIEYRVQKVQAYTKQIAEAYLWADSKLQNASTACI